MGFCLVVSSFCYILTSFNLLCMKPITIHYFFFLVICRKPILTLTQFSCTAGRGLKGVLGQDKSFEYSSSENNHVITIGRGGEGRREYHIQSSAVGWYKNR